MEKIDGIDLSALATEASAEIAAERSAKIKTQIRAIRTDVAAWEVERAAAVNKTKQLDGQIAKARERLDKIAAGDWSQLSKEGA